MSNLFNQRIDIFPATFKDELIGDEVFGYDIRILDDRATLQDYIDALNDFAQKYLAPCIGCDGCCHERAPLISTDIFIMEKLLPPSKNPAHNVIENYSDIFIFDDGAIDIPLKRNKNGSCIFLDEKNKYCQNHQTRPFTCNSYFCINKSLVAEDLRNSLINAGEDQLIHLLWQEEIYGATPILKDKVNILDYPENGFKNKKSLSEVLIKEIIPHELWQKLIED